MKKIILGVGLIGIYSAGFCNVHKFNGSDGSALLTNRQPIINKNIDPKAATLKDLKPDLQSEINVEYTYESSSTSVAIQEKVNVPVRQLYKASLCKINTVIVPCYTYSKTLPATSYTVPSTRSINVDPKKVLQESITNQKED